MCDFAFLVEIFARLIERILHRPRPQKSICAVGNFSRLQVARVAIRSRLDYFDAAIYPQALTRFDAFGLLAGSCMYSSNVIAIALSNSLPSGVASNSDIATSSNGEPSRR